jgi:exodeoxyribonuclease VII small subunit
MAKKDSGYRQSIDEIEAILTKIENGETDIDDLAVEIKRASKLLQECKDKLFQTEREVGKIIKSDDSN